MPTINKAKEALVEAILKAQDESSLENYGHYNSWQILERLVIVASLEYGGAPCLEISTIDEFIEQNAHWLECDEEYHLIECGDFCGWFKEHSDRATKAKEWWTKHNTKNLG